jgi:AraC family transcriptional regulator
MQSSREYYEERILRIQLYIQRNLDRPLPLEELARVAGFSPFHFHRIFSGMVGEPVKEFIRRLRLERAARELIYSSRQVIDIALEAGYETHESFTRAFSSMFGQPPRFYRHDHRNGEVLESAARGTTFTATIIRPGGTGMKAKTEKFKPMTVAYGHHVGPYNQCGVAWEKLCAGEAVQRAKTADPVYIGVCYDDPDFTDAEKIRYDACMTVSDDFTPGGGIQKQVIRGGDYVVLRHHGFEGIHEAYKWLFGEWLPGSGREAESAPSLEIVRNPDKCPGEETIIDICVPLK